MSNLIVIIGFALAVIGAGALGLIVTVYTVNCLEELTQ